MRPYAELLEFNQPNPIRKEGFTRVRDAFPGLGHRKPTPGNEDDWGIIETSFYDPERIIEFAGRWDYGENNARRLGEMTQLSAAKGVMVPIIQKYIGMGHESMIEMGDATFFIECSRVVSHELVRHRIASYQQESQRFVKYDGTDEDVFFMPDGIDGIKFEDELHDDGSMCDEGETAEEAFGSHYQYSMNMYKELRRIGVSPQLARYVLPNSFRTRLIMKTNVREWRHIIRLRLDRSAQPEMQELMQQIYDQLVDVFPNAMYGVLDGGRGIR